ncbi:hypothetical protein DSY14_27370 [Nocardiopsis sp. MG754419]|nr:hypothetical protein [Nocardiopsis sp. MG754419]
MWAILALAVSACGDQDGSDPEEAPTMEGTEEEDDRDDGDDENGDEGEGAAAEGDVQVRNFHGDEQGFDDQRPEEYVATEFTTFTDMEWDQWDERRARGEGEILGTWCMDQGCQDDPYDITVELGDPVEIDGTSYFSTYTVTDYDAMPDETRAALEGADDGRLALPS